MTCSTKVRCTKEAIRERDRTYLEAARERLARKWNKTRQRKREGLREGFGDADTECDNSEDEAFIIFISQKVCKQLVVPRVRFEKAEAKEEY